MIYLSKKFKKKLITEFSQSKKDFYVVKLSCGYFEKEKIDDTIDVMYTVWQKIVQKECPLRKTIVSCVKKLCINYDDEKILFFPYFYLVVVKKPEITDLDFVLKLRIYWQKLFIQNSGIKNFDDIKVEITQTENIEEAVEFLSCVNIEKEKIIIEYHQIISFLGIARQIRNEFVQSVER